MNKDPVGEISFELGDSMFDINIEEIKHIDVSDNESIAELVGCMDIPSES